VYNKNLRFAQPISTASQRNKQPKRVGYFRAQGRSVLSNSVNSRAKKRSLEGGEEIK